MALRRIHFDLALGVVGMILGASAMITFAFVYHNYEAGVMGGYSGMLAFATFILHLNHYRNNLYQYTSKSFERYEMAGFMGLLFGFATMIFYTFLQCYKRTSVFPVATSIVIKLLWSFMSFKWGLILFLSSRRYSNLTEDNHYFFTSEVME